MNFYESIRKLKENLEISSNFDNEGNFINNNISYYDTNKNKKSYHENLVNLYESEKQDTIRKAIRNKNIITFTYSGDYTNSTGVRVVEPYVLGVSEAGNKVIRAYQISGSTDTPDDMPGWRLFLTKNISNIDMSSTGFSGDRPGYNKQGDDGMVRIDIHAAKTRRQRQQEQ